MYSGKIPDTEERISVEGLDGKDVLALQEYLLALQQAFMETLKERLVAKSITYHVRLADIFG